MWRLMLGIVVCLQAGTLRAGEGEEETAGPPGCHGHGASGEATGAASGVASGAGSGEAAGEDCAADEAVPAAPVGVLPAAPVVPAAAPSLPAFATVSFRNDVGTKFRLVEAHFTMDGADLPIVLTGAERGKSYVVVTGSMKPGPHVVTARLTYQGERRVFTYMNGYKLNVRSEQVLTTPENRSVSFTVVGSENKGMNVPLDRRVLVKVEENAAKH